MNQGKRYLRYTMVALLGFMVLGIVMNRIYNSAVDVSTPEWQRRALSLGLAVRENTTGVLVSGIKATTQSDLEALRDFNQVEVDGDLAVEFVGATGHKVSLVPATDQAWSIRAELYKDGMLRLIAGPDTAGATLRIEAPTLTRIDATRSRLLSVEGIESPALAVTLNKVENVHLKQNKVERWNLKSDGKTEVLLDKPAPGTTTKAIYNMAGGQITMRNAE